MEKKTYEELVAEIEQYKKEKEQELATLKGELEEEKRKVAQFTITGITNQVKQEIKEKEPVEFDFDF